jgi:CDP-diacylglycerol--glycerol-3-phosphate 3-phosphatidyltransferase
MWPMQDWQKKLPMWITSSRIFAAPVVILTMMPDSIYWKIASAILFILASITDYYDGYFARKYQATSNMGKFMDPIADKILVTSVLVHLVALGKVDPWMVIVILARDTFIGGLRSVAAADGLVIDAKPTGKWKTALQMIAIPAVIISETWLHIPFAKLGLAMLWVSVILSVVSGVEYVLAYKKHAHKRGIN